MGDFFFRKICAAAARLAAALVLFGGSLLGGEALLAAAGGGNVAHAQQAATNLQMTWSGEHATQVSGVLTWTQGSYGASYQVVVRTGNRFGGVVHTSPKVNSNPGTHTFTYVFTRGTRYWIRVLNEQTIGGNSTQSDINLFFDAPQLVLAGAAVSINTAYGDSDDFDVASVTLTWEKDSNDVIGWDIEVRDGACSGQSCTVALITSLTVAAATRTISFPGISFSRGLPYSFRIRGKNSQRTSDWANHTLSVAFSGTPAKFTMGWSADAVTNTTFGGTLRWNFAALHNLAALAVYQGRCSGAECVSDNLIYDSGGGHIGAPFAPPAGDRRQVFAATTFTRGTEYTFRFSQGGVGSVVETLSYFRAPGTPVVAQAISVGLVFAGGDGFDQAATLTWQKDYNDATGWDIEVREGTCVTVNCSTSPLVTTFSNLAVATTSQIFGVMFARGIQYSFRIRARLSAQIGDWHNNNMGSRGTPAGRSGAIDAFRMEWLPNPENPTLYGGRYRWNGPPTDNKWGLAVYPRNCTGGGPSRCQANQSATPIFDTGNVHGSAADNSSNSIRNYDFALTTFTAGQDYTFLLMQGNSPGGLHRQLAAPGGVAVAVSVSATFGPQVIGNLNANLTWGKSSSPNLSGWNVEVREGLCTALDCSALDLVASFADLPASARSQSFDALFVRGSVYSFRVQGKNGSTLGVWNNANKGFQVTVATLATPETPVLSSMVAGLRLYLVQSSVNSAYVAAFDDGTGEARFTIYQPANVTAGGVFNAGNIDVDRYAVHDVLVTVWGAHADGVASTLSGASIIVTAYSPYARPMPPPPPPMPPTPSAVRNVNVAAISPTYAGITISWDAPANINEVSVARYEVSYGGTITVSAQQSGGYGVSLFSNLFGLAADYSRNIPVTLRAISETGVYGAPSVVFPSHAAGNIDSWAGAQQDTDNIPEIVRVEPFLKNPPDDDQILFRVYVGVTPGKWKMENFRFDGFQGADLQNTENTEVEGGFGSYQLLDAFNHIIMVTVDTVDEGEINASAFPSGTYSIRVRSFNGVWGTHGTPPPEQFSQWYPFSYNVADFPFGGLSPLNAKSGDGHLVVNGTYDGDNSILSYQYIHPVGGETVSVQGAGGVRFVVDNLINGVAYTISARLGDNSWRTAVGTPYSADAPTIFAFLGYDARVLGTVTNTHSNVATLRWHVGFDGAQNPRVELLYRGATQTVEHDPGSSHYSRLVTVAKNEAHVYTLRAHSSGGSSGYATATVFLPQTIPSAPANAHASPARGGFITVRWTTPKYTGGAPISHYSVVALPVVEIGNTVTTTTGVTVNASVAEASGVKSYVVSGAPLGVRQCLAIRAYNSAFPTVAGPAALACATPGATPAAPILNALIGITNTANLVSITLDLVSVYSSFSSEDGNTLTMSWNNVPGVQHQNTLLGWVPAASVEYLLNYADASGAPRNAAVLGRGGITLVAADGIKHGTRYVFTLRARNMFGVSPANVFTLTTKQAPPLPPSPPRSFVAERTDSANMVRVRWGLPIGNNYGGRPNDKTHADLVYRIIYYPLKDGTQQVSQVTIDGVVRNVTTTVYPLANYATVHITTAMAMHTDIQLSVTTADWRFLIQSFNTPISSAYSGSFPLVRALYDLYADDAEKWRALEMKNVVVGVSDLSQDPAVVMEGFTISWDPPQNADGDSWPTTISHPTHSRWVRVVRNGGVLVQNGVEVLEADSYKDILQDVSGGNNDGGGWGVSYSNGEFATGFNVCANSGCRGNRGTGAVLSVSFNYGRTYDITLIPHVRDETNNVHYWGKATVVQVAPYIHPTTINAGKPYNVRTDGPSITWLPLGIGQGHFNISISHYELTELTGGGIEAVPLSPGNPRKQLVFTPAEEANAGKHSVGITPQSNKGVFRHAQLTTPIPLRIYRYEEMQTVEEEEVVVTSTLYDRSRYYRVQTFFKSHVNGHVFAAQNGVVTVQYTPPLPPGEAAPDAPANLNMAFNTAAQEATISWTRPDDKGYRILDYALLYNGFAARVSGHLQEYALAMRAGASHTVQLVARNGNGVGPAASVVFASPVGAPGIPVLAAVKSRNAAVSVSWDAPASNGGAAITGYIASVFGGGEAMSVAGDANARSHIFTGLTNGTIYTLGIYAGNSGATGRPALVTAAPHPTRPSAPNNLALTANGHASLGVSWAAPSDTGGAAISRYLVYLDGFVAATVGSSGTNAQLTGLAFGPSGISYNVAVAAQNARGEGAKAAGVATVMGKPGEPRNLEVVGGADIAVFYWDPANNAGSELLGYTITYADSGGTDTMVSIAPAAVEHTINGLGNGVYTYTMFAYNAHGNGETVFAANVTSTVGPPFRPTSVTVNPGANQIAIEWGETNNNGGEITAFLLYDGDTLVTTITNTAARAYTFTGLTVRGQIHTLGVAAQNAHGIGVRLNFVAAPLATPGAPANFVATPGFQQIALSWSGASVFGGTINGFFLSGTDINGTVSLATNVTSTLITGLTTNREYAFTLRARNTIGLGSEAVVRATPPANLPSAPQNVMVESILNSISLSWQAVADNGDDPNITYEVYANNTLAPVAQNVTVMEYFFTGLTVGSTATVGVAARNSRGASPIVLTPVTVYGAPAAPQVSIAVANLSVILYLTAPTDTGGLPLTDYVLIYGIAAEEARTTVTQPWSTEIIVSGLTNDTEYTFIVNAKNRLGATAAVTASATPQSGAPFQPANFRATITDMTGEIRITWDDTGDNGSAITAYFVYLDGVTVMTLNDANARAHTLTGLNRGQNYTVGVAAANGSTVNAGLGIRAQTIASPLGKPGAPISVSISAAYPTVVITWVEGSTYNGAILSYAVNGTAINNPNARGHQDIVSVIGMRSYTIYAVNAGGNGDTVTVDITVTAIAPKAPNLAPPQPSETDGAIDINWTAPANDGGAAITAYIISVNGVAAHTITVAPGSNVNAFSYTLTMDEAGASLEYGTTYLIEVVAQNSVGIGDKAADMGGLLSVPGAPKTFMAAVGDSQLSLSWGAANPNGTPVTGYVLTRTTPAGGSPQKLDATALYTVIGGLTNGVEYVYELYALNTVVGNGAIATVTASPGKEPGMPGNLRANLAGGTAATVEWSAPADDGGRAIQSYELRYIVAGETTGWITITINNATATVATISGLNASLNYRFELRAKSTETNFGYGAWATVVTQIENPGAPRNLRANLAGGTTATVEWSAPASNGGRAILGYELRYTEAATTTDWSTVTLANGNASTATVVSLVASLNYRFELRAQSNFGYGERALLTTDGKAPEAPGNLKVYPERGGAGTVTLVWTEPNNNGRNLSSYELRYIEATVTMTNYGAWKLHSSSIGAAATAAVVSGLDSNLNYRFALRAGNSFGYGKWASYSPQGSQVAELDQAILPVAAAALSRQWSQAINQRLSQVGALGGGGLQANALGASFGKGQMERGVAELLRKHGGALANGQKLDGDALRNLTFSLGGGSGAGAGATGGGMGAGYSKLLNGGGIWGGASYTNMENKKGETPWEGDNIAYYAGIDRAMDSERRLLAGVMFAHNRLETNYTKSADNSRGVYNLRATGAHPYLLWRSPDNASRLWATFGYGAGEVESAAANQAKTTRDAKIYSASGGLRRNLWSNAKGAELDGQADFAVANIEVDNPGEANAKADSKNFRALLEARNHFKTTNGGVASPFMRAGFRHQSDDIDSKSGWEFSAGWRWNAKGGGWNGEVSGGAAGLSGGYKEWNANAMLRKNDTGGKGLWLTLRPQYGINGGNPVAATGDLWRAMTSTNANANDRAASLSLDVGYGLFGASALWRPFVGATVGDNAGEYRAGAKWEHRLRADMGMSAGVSAKRKPAAADQMQLNFAVTY